MTQRPRPSGPVPKEIREWLFINHETPCWVCICRCGRWFTYMDHLAPHHFEMCYCKRCGYPNKPKVKTNDLTT